MWHCAKIVAVALYWLGTGKAQVPESMSAMSDDGSRQLRSKAIKQTLLKETAVPSRPCACFSGHRVLRIKHVVKETCGEKNTHLIKTFH